jgi:hypothetical protein
MGVEREEANDECCKGRVEAERGLISVHPHKIGTCLDGHTAMVIVLLILETPRTHEFGFTIRFGVDHFQWETPQTEQVLALFATRFRLTVAVLALFEERMQLLQRMLARLKVRQLCVLATCTCQQPPLGSCARHTQLTMKVPSSVNEHQSHANLTIDGCVYQLEGGESSRKLSTGTCHTSQ